MVATILEAHSINYSQASGLKWNLVLLPTLCQDIMILPLVYCHKYIYRHPVIFIALNQRLTEEKNFFLA